MTSPLMHADPFAILGHIAAHPHLFPAAYAEAHKFVTTLVVRQLKLHRSDLTTLRAIHDALGAESFLSVVDGMTDAQVEMIVAKFDGSPPQSTEGALPRRQRLQELAEGSAEPSPDPQNYFQRLTAKSATLITARDIHARIGHTIFCTLLGDLHDQHVATLAKKFDPHNSALEQSSPDDARRHLIALARRAVEPVDDKPEFLDYKSAGATRDSDPN